MRSGVTTRWVGTAMVVLGLGGGIARGDEDAELRELKETVRGMQQTIEKLNEKIERMERDRTEKAAAPAPTPETGHAENVIAPQGVGPQATPMAGVVIAPPPINEEAAEGQAENVISYQGIGPQAPIDPKLRGFFQVPYTKAIIRFNAKPRVDFTYDTQNPGDDNRFVPALIPVLGDPNQGGGPVFNANSQGLATDHRRARARNGRQPALLLPERLLRLRQRRVQLSAPAALRAASTTSPSGRRSARSRIPTSGRIRSTTKVRTR